jgi:hypothetical protein
LTHYLGIIDHGDGNWGVRFPDLPGCYGADAVVPKPRSLDELLASGEIDAAAGEAAVLIGVCGRLRWAAVTAALVP